MSIKGEMDKQNVIYLYNVLEFKFFFVLCFCLFFYKKEPIVDIQDGTDKCHRHDAELTETDTKGMYCMFLFIQRSRTDEKKSIVKNIKQPSSVTKGCSQGLLAGAQSVVLVISVLCILIDMGCSCQNCQTVHL